MREFTRNGLRMPVMKGLRDSKGASMKETRVLPIDFIDL